VVVEVAHSSKHLTSYASKSHRPFTHGSWKSQHVVTTRSHHLDIDKGKDDLTKRLSSGLVASCQQSVSVAHCAHRDTHTWLLDRLGAFTCVRTPMCSSERQTKQWRREQTMEEIMSQTDRHTHTQTHTHTHWQTGGGRESRAGRRIRASARDRARNNETKIMNEKCSRDKEA
jgi:hypothetical protein